MSFTPDDTLYVDRPEWADVTPIPQYEGVNPVAPIFYSEEYKDATDYFRGIVKLGETSQRVLELTEAIIRMNPAHYSAWQYRYKTLLALNADLRKELALMDPITIQFLKTYQVWHHRRLILTQLGSVEVARSELEFIENILEADAKNYHTWSYRQWLLAHFNDKDLWVGERAYVEQLLDADARNNSAWHHRFFVVWQSGVRSGDENRQDVLRRELAYTKDMIALAPNNASAWNYLRGVLDWTKTPYASLTTFVLPYTTAEPARSDSAEEVVDLENPRPEAGAELPCSAALEFLADIRENEGGPQVHRAIEIWKSLANEHDTMRKKYWEYRIRESLQRIDQ